MMKLFIYIVGFMLMTMGFFYVIAYINLFTFGYSLLEYSKFMLSHIQTYSLPIGMLLIAIALYKKGARR